MKNLKVKSKLANNHQMVGGFLKIVVPIYQLGQIGGRGMKGNILAIFIFSIILFATFLGWYAQDIAYYFKSHFLYQDPFKTLIFVTTTSVLLFIITFVINIILLAFRKVKSGMYITLLITNVFIGFFTSLWSLFVLAMWWG